MIRKRLIKFIVILSSGILLITASGILFSFWLYQRDLKKLLDLEVLQQWPNITNPAKLNDEQLLIKSAYRGDFSIVSQLLTSGTNCNVRGQLQTQIFWGTHYYDVTPLMAAVIGYRTQIVHALLKAGANADEKNRQGNTALCIMMMNPNIRCDQAPTDIVLDVDKECELCCPYFDSKAVLLNQIAISRILIKYGADPKKLCSENATLLDLADYCRGNFFHSNYGPLCFQLILLFFREGVPLNRQWMPGQGIMDYDPIDLLRKLANDKKILLIEESYHGDLVALNSRIHKNENIDVENMIGETPLIAAVEGGHPEVVNALIRAGAHLNEKDWHGSALVWAVELGEIEALRSLLDAGAEINVQDSEGVIALSRVIQMRQTENIRNDGSYKFTRIIKMLLKAGAALHAASLDGTTAFMEAVKLKDYEIAEKLIAAGARINDEDVEGQTALMIAAKQADTRMVEILVHNGADITLKDKNGMTAMKLAQAKFYEKIICPSGDGDFFHRESLRFPDEIRTILRKAAAKQ